MNSSKRQHSLKAINLLLVITMMLAGVVVNVSPAQAAAGDIEITEPSAPVVVTAESREVDVAFTVDSTDNPGSGQYRILVGNVVDEAFETKATFGPYSVSFTGGTGQNFARTITIPELADGSYDLKVEVNFSGETEWLHSKIAAGKVIVNNVDGIEITAPTSQVFKKSGDELVVSFTVDDLEGAGQYDILLEKDTILESVFEVPVSVTFAGGYNQPYEETITIPVLDDGVYDLVVKAGVLDLTNQVEATKEAILVVDNTIAEPVLTSPEGGEVWTIGSVHNITWEEYVPGEEVTISLHFSNNAGGAWSLIAEDVENAPYAWTVPPFATTRARIKIKVEDLAGNIADDTSANFTIYAVDSTPPVVAMTAPVDGATIGPNVTLQASAADPESGIAKVEFYQDSNLLGEGELVGGYYELDVKGLTGEPSFKAVATNGIGLVATSAAVTVTVEVEDEEAPTVWFVAPSDDNEVVGFDYHFKVNATDASPLGSMNLYAVDASLEERLLCGPIAPEEPEEEGDPIYSCIADVPDGTVSIKAKVSDAAGNVGVDSVDVIVDRVAPKLGDGLLTPAAGAVLQLGAMVEIIWAPITEEHLDSVDLELRRDGVKVADIVVDAESKWTVAGAPGSDYEVCMIVTDEAGNTAEDCNSPITIWGTDTSDPAVGLTAPDPNPEVDSSYKGVAELKATASDPESFIQKVAFFVKSEADGAAYVKVGEDAVVPYNPDAEYVVAWDTTGFEDGTYSVKAVATNGVGLTKEAVVGSVVIDNTAPVLSNMQPSTAAPISDFVTFSITVIDSGVGIDSVVFEYYDPDREEPWVDMGDVAGGDDSYLVDFDTAEVDNGWLSIRVTASDGLGNEASLETAYFVQNGALEPGQVVINLQVGWNLISMSLIPNDTSIDVLLADLMASDSVAQVVAWPYNGDLGSIVEKRWNGVQLTDITDLEDGHGYWIEMIKPGVLVFEGTPLPEPPMAPPSYLVYAGWNLIGFKSQQIDISAESYLGADVSASMRMMYGFDAATGFYTQIMRDTELEPGSGYWLAVGANGTIYPPAW